MPLITVDHLHDSRLDVYRHLTRSNLTRWSGRFIAEGRKVVRRLLESDYEILSVVAAERRVEEVAAWFAPDVPLYAVPDGLASELVGWNFHEGVLACGRRKPPLDLAAVVPNDQSRLTLVVCPNVNDPDNIAAIIRTGCAFGIDALVLGKGCADPFSRRVLRVSMGNAFFLPIVESDDLRGDLLRLRDDWGVELAATVLDGAAEPLEEAARPPRLALLFGNEAHGLEREWIELCTRRLTIPMERGTDSLNVAATAAICLYYFQRVAREGGSV